MANHKAKNQAPASAVATSYSFYVNPNAKERDDPEQLQKLAQPILEEWYADGNLKENILRAVLSYNKIPPKVENKAADRDFDQIMKRLEGLIRGIGQHSQSEKTISADLEDISEELEDFGSQYLNYGD